MDGVDRAQEHQPGNEGMIGTGAGGSRAGELSIASCMFFVVGKGCNTPRRSDPKSGALLRITLVCCHSGCQHSTELPAEAQSTRDMFYGTAAWLRFVAGSHADRRLASMAKLAHKQNTRMPADRIGSWMRRMRSKCSSPRFDTRRSART